MMPWVAHGVDSPRVNIGSWCELAALSQSRRMANLVTQHNASVAQLAEHALRKRMVMGSIPIRGFLLRESDNICVRVWDCKDVYTL